MTPQKTQEHYQAAMAALRQVALSPGLTPTERLAARDGLRELKLRYVDHVELELQALLAQYEDFLNSMTIGLAALQGASPKPALDRLNRIVREGTALMATAARADSGGVKTSRRAGRRALGVAAAPPADSGPLRILCVHGVGHQENDPAFETAWRNAITAGLSEWTHDRAFQIEFVAYDDLFAADPPSAWEVANALVKLGASGLVHGLGDMFVRPRGFGEISQAVRWTAGMVVQWAENDTLRARARQRVLDHTRRFDPHVILAHSLGTLLSYDGFARPEGHPLIAGRTFVTFGSQIGNPFVRSTLGGRIEPLPGVRHWYHLFNPNDAAFTASLRMADPAFEQVVTEFDIDGMLDHDAGEYLKHANTTNIVWRALAMPAGGAARGLSVSAAALTQHALKARPARIRKPERRALLVGINDYPNPADRLEGCVNDVFLMSSLLQDSGFSADDIRVVLNDRATARGMVERLEWLLEGTEDGQDRVFYYSGHGAQIPGYGVGEKVDRKDECLVAYDFDWSREHAVTDDQFFDLYSQLPYRARFLTIFDCCHSGGMTRHGAARVRGLSPPDDIRHRELKWDTEHGMWVPRDFSEVKKIVEERSQRPALFGTEGDKNRLGCCAELRTNRRKFQRACQDYGHKGPFMPIILQACGEKQFSYEYRHGVQSFGAFSYSLAQILRAPKKRQRPLSWAELVGDVADKLEALHYDQTPCLVCPTALREQPVPWPVKVTRR